MSRRVRRITTALAVTLALGVSVLIGAAAPAGAAPTSTPTGWSSDPNQTLAYLRGASQPQLDQFFVDLGRSGLPDDMPGYDVAAQGYVLCPGLGAICGPLQTLISNAIWQGKVWYTNANGGYLNNRVFGDVEAHQEAVSYGTSWLDNKPAIIVAGRQWDFAWSFDNIREVQPGLYLGYAMLKADAIPGIPNTKLLSFVLDFNHPNASPCLLCGLNLGSIFPPSLTDLIPL